MIAVTYRFVDDDGKPTGWHGMAFAKNKKDLYWVIDRVGDPSCCEFAVSSPGQTLCIKGNIDDPDSCDDDEIDCYQVIETDSDGFEFTGMKWKRANWDDVDIFSANIAE